MWYMNSCRVHGLWPTRLGNSVLCQSLSWGRTSVETLKLIVVWFHIQSWFLHYPRVNWSGSLHADLGLTSPWGVAIHPMTALCLLPDTLGGWTTDIFSCCSHRLLQFKLDRRLRAWIHWIFWKLPGKWFDFWVDLLCWSLPACWADSLECSLSGSDAGSASTSVAICA